MTLPHVLIVADEPDIRELVQAALERMRVASTAAATLNESRALLDRGGFQLCLTDLQLPDGDGIELVQYVRERYPELPIAVFTAHGSTEAAVRALKAGAFDVVSKPVNLEALRRLVDTALELNLNPVDDRRARRTLLGDSEPMQRIRAMIVKVARSQAPVAICGESGTGKELVARLIHDKGPRRAQPFIPVNCGAIPSELMESEFFGHKRGSFTGATTDKQGLFQAAHGGTLFLDEVAELPLPMQVKLLRAIQEKAIRPVGGHHEIPVDVRILSATHKNLSELVAQGRFRQDLYYRINVIELRVPPLRERPDDIPLLAEHVFERLCGDLPAALRPQLGEDALHALQQYAFPGNVRELENILERALTLREGSTIRAADLRLPAADLIAALPEAEPGGEEFALDAYLGAVERRIIDKALRLTGGNKTAAAGLLGISFRALRYRLKKLGMN